MPCPPPPYQELYESDHNVVLYSRDGVPISNSNPLPVFVVNSTGGGGVTYQLYDENPTAFDPPVAAGSNSQALGDGAYGRHTGGLVHSAGSFGVAGDAQTGDYVLRNTTSSNAWTELFLDGSSDVLILPDRTTWAVSATFSARCIDVGSTEVSVFTVKCAVERSAGALSTRILSGSSTSVYGRDDPSWQVRLQADTYAGALKVSVRGHLAKTIRWVAHLSTVEVMN